MCLQKATYQCKYVPLGLASTKHRKRLGSHFVLKPSIILAPSQTFTKCFAPSFEEEVAKVLLSRLYKLVILLMFLSLIFCSIIDFHWIWNYRCHVNNHFSTWAFYNKRQRQFWSSLIIIISPFVLFLIVFELVTL